MGETGLKILHIPSKLLHVSSHYIETLDKIKTIQVREYEGGKIKYHII